MQKNDPNPDCPQHGLDAPVWVGSFPHPMTGEEVPAHWEYPNGDNDG